MEQGGRPTRARVRRLAAVVMLLLALGAGMLVSAGSAHHAAGAAEAATAGVALAPLDHEHHHGNEWTPTPSQRLHPVARVALLTMVVALPGAESVPVDGSVATTPPPLALSGVLRV
ncbi:MAG: hypothetical protein ABW022_07010 [Actinoplanes sp.]